MIGCEKLCGACDACGSIVWCLDHEAIVDMNTIVTANQALAMRAIFNPSALADLLARSLRGRGVVMALERVHNGPSGERVALSLRSDGQWGKTQLGTSEARAAISRLLAAGLCSADEALRLLEAP